jgi:hypothetical protein
MRCGGARTSDPILLYVSLNAGSRRANNTFTESWIDSRSDTNSRYLSPLGNLYDFVMSCIMIIPSRHWSNRAQFRLSHEVYTCSMTRQHLPRVRAAPVGEGSDLCKQRPTAARATSTQGTTHEIGIYFHHSWKLRIIRMEDRWIVL